ncbi:MAG: sporulation protein YqfC [Defluviitaleaceae bacterium]|nr:sporulation protein YqfC [Defluviitaleaceae bacterium]
MIKQKKQAANASTNLNLNLNPKQAISQKITSALELPKEVVMNLPLITLIGNEDMTVENFKGVLEYSEERVRINTTAGIVRVEGKKLLLKQITADNIGIVGNIMKVEFLV